MKDFLVKSSALALFVGGILLYIAPLLGYGLCIYKFVKCDFSNKTSWKPEIVYGVGVFTGLGIVVGYIDLGE